MSQPALFDNLDTLMSSRQGSLANHFHALEIGAGQTMSVFSGRTFIELFVRLSLSYSFSKMFPVLSTLGRKTKMGNLELKVSSLPEYFTTWPRWGTMLNGELSPQTPLVLPTFENDYSALRYYPTPTASDAGGGGSKKMALRALRREKRKGKHNVQLKLRDLVMIQAPPGENLNPQLCEYLMGYPPDWTNIG